VGEQGGHPEVPGLKAGRGGGLLGVCIPHIASIFL
jgi:hypothetical protein